MSDVVHDHAGTDPSPRPLRADAARNRRALLEAARRVIAEHGLDCPAQEIAKAAGVGVGTLYRHFPTKQELVAAAFHQRFEDLMEAIRAVAAEHAGEPVAAFEAALRVFAERKAEDLAFFDAVRMTITWSADLLNCRTLLLDEFEPLLRAAQDAGSIRRDIEVTDLTMLMGTLARPALSVRELDPRLWERYFAIMLDGLRAEGARPLPAVPAPPR